MKGVCLYDEDFFVIKEDLEAIKENITRILLTSPGERVNNPEFGSPIQSYIFEKENVVRDDIVNSLYDIIERWEPRITVNSIEVEEELYTDISKLYINMSLTQKTTLQEFDYNTIISY